ncbi:vWA domain-containing protein [Paenibacillus eucommiae]|uniref:Stress response protein SCP2 n=1 Tax=Paenibacillus eucommiae TaxID=1355755 RepID=A0ABS4IVB9_9BACL|nr:VWA domain-containing protein [Paenibacillus eucommiae]MBP1991453.1 stress response protein SCP2 [Paenibacillus eucommiae]
MPNNTITLVTGANTPLDKEKMLEITIEWKSSPADLDVSCFMVNATGSVPSDDYFIFYNQPNDPKKHIQFSSVGGHATKFTINLEGLLATEIDKCTFAATLDGPGTFTGVQGCRAIARSSQTEVHYDIKDVKEETSLVLMELYRHQGWFKLRAVGRGFNGGLKPLAEAHGVVVEDEPAAVEAAPPQVPVKAPVSTSASTPATPVSTPAPAAGSVAASTTGQPMNLARPSQNSQPSQAQQSHQSQQSQQPPTSSINLTKIDLLKKKVSISLQKKKLDDGKARVAVVFDASGSMSQLYSKGTVQRAFERVLAIAACMDDDGTLDVWFFGSKSMRAPSVTERDYEDYVKRTYPSPKAFGGLGPGNNEPVVMEDVIKKYTVEEPNKSMPTYIIFFSDGGIYETKKIAKLLVQSSKTNIFWQFVGIGNANYGVLRKLDDLPGRFIDNANFFALDDLDKVSDEELYDRMFDEYPVWLKQAKQKGLLT